MRGLLNICILVHQALWKPCDYGSDPPITALIELTMLLLNSHRQRRTSVIIWKNWLATTTSGTQHSSSLLSSGTYKKILLLKHMLCNVKGLLEIYEKSPINSNIKQYYKNYDFQNTSSFSNYKTSKIISSTFKWKNRLRTSLFSFLMVLTDVFKGNLVGC